MNYLALTLILCMQYIINSHGYYYWKDYHRTIPLDAYSPGQDSNQQRIYIGQALLFDNPYQGIYPTTIHVDKDVYVAMVGARKTNYFVQILCSTDPENFEWILANSTHLHLMNNDNELVRGGVEIRNGVVAIGRIRIHGETVIGKVMSEMIGVADMWFVHNQHEKKSVTFEVLTYNDKNKYCSYC